MLFNISSRQYKTWSPEQKTTSKPFGKVIECGIPKLKQESGEEVVEREVKRFIQKIQSLKKNQLQKNDKETFWVSITADVAFTTLLAVRLYSLGIECLVPYFNKKVEKTSDGNSRTNYAFVRYRTLVVDDAQLVRLKVLAASDSSELPSPSSISNTNVDLKSTEVKTNDKSVIVNQKIQNTAQTPVPNGSIQLNSRCEVEESKGDLPRGMVTFSPEKKVEPKTEDASFVLTPSQQSAFDKLQMFINDRSQKFFILKGYAGTGKTTLMKKLLEQLRKQNLSYLLMASTGRAAKILSDATGETAATVHSVIYSFTGLNQDVEKLMEQPKMEGDGQLLLNFDKVVVQNQDYDQRFYIVDESSMIDDTKDKEVSQAQFGTGRLLSDLINFDSKGRFVFVGDECQLAPMNTSFSPALSTEYIANTFHQQPIQVQLTDIVRQQSGNDIVVAAKKIRSLYANPPKINWAKFPLKGFKNIVLHDSSTSMLADYINTVKKKGYSAATLITATNKKCMELTKMIRPALGFKSGELLIEEGDLLLVTQNNFATGLMNGDMVRVKKIGRREIRAGLTFVQTELVELFSDMVVSVPIVEDILYSGTTNLSKDMQNNLLLDFSLRMKEKGIKQKDPLFNEFMLVDPYLNALRCVYGFAITCHKAQGGEWDEVYLDSLRSKSHDPQADDYQWVYTAVTRAKLTLHIVNDYCIV